MKPADLIPQFDAFLAERGLALEGIAVGGAALALLGLINRETRDFDLLDPPLAAEVQEASQVFAASIRASGEILGPDWLNNGPAALGALLPDGWKERLQPLYQGKAVRLWTLASQDLLLTKVFALCDRGLDLGDCLAMRPKPEELAWAVAWVAAQDLNPDWPAHVHATLKDLGVRLGHDL